jgi:hypothetical protein
MCCHAGCPPPAGCTCAVPIVPHVTGKDTVRHRATRRASCAGGVVMCNMAGGNTFGGVTRSPNRTRFGSRSGTGSAISPEAPIGCRRGGLSIAGSSSSVAVIGKSVGGTGSTSTVTGCSVRSIDHLGLSHRGPVTGPGPAIGGPRRAEAKPVRYSVRATLSWGDPGSAYVFTFAWTSSANTSARSLPGCQA